MHRKTQRSKSSGFGSLTGPSDKLLGDFASCSARSVYTALMTFFTLKQMSSDSNIPKAVMNNFALC